MTHGDVGALCEVSEHRPHSTGKERDTESGNDYFGARYYASTMGRFLSPDPSELYFADPANPQSLNLYAYVQNNPLIHTDPTGMECVWDDGSFDSKDDPDTGSLAKCEGGKNGGHWIDPTAFATLGLGDWSKNPDPTIVGMMNQLSPAEITVSVTAGAPSALAPIVDVIGSSIPGMIDNAGSFLLFTPPNRPDPYILATTHYCGPGGGGITTGFMDAACKAHDQCYAAAGISASYNLSASNGGSGGTLAQATAAQACNQALYNAARLNAGSPGAKAVREWLKNGDKTPFGYILHPGTEAASWKEQ